MAVKPKKNNETSDDSNWPYGKKNYMYFALAMLAIIIGFVALGQGSDTFSVILLLLGYCVLIPIALIVKDNSKNEESAESN